MLIIQMPINLDSKLLDSSQTFLSNHKNLCNKIFTIQNNFWHCQIFKFYYGWESNIWQIQNFSSNATFHYNYKWVQFILYAVYLYKT